MRYLLGLLLLSLAFAMPPWAGQGMGGSVSDTISAMPYEELSEAEVASLEYMIQEEKLARDVYRALYEKWGATVFYNIAQSEQNHVDTVKALLDKYNIPNPLPSDEEGVYRDESFVSLYQQLVEEGSKSLADAYRVGALIEDLDIKDLQERLEEVDNEDIRWAYENLMRASRNHMRAFVGQLRAMGEDYTPQYISQEEFEAIMGSDYETGNVDRWGNIAPQGPQGVPGPQGRAANPAVQQGSGGMAVGIETFPPRAMVEERVKAKGYRPLEVVQEGNRFRVKAMKTYRLFGLFPVDAEVEVVVDEQGNVVDVKRPWWAFLALE